MKNKFTISVAIIFLLGSFEILSQSLKWEDRMNGDNSVSGLQSRGWVVLNADGGGTTNPWFQGTVSVFPSYEGPDSGYVAANYNGANSSDVIDQWLISPTVNISVGDSLSFVARSPETSSFDDSIEVLISTNAGTNPSDFISLGRFLVPTSGWSLFYWISEISATTRFAIRYYLFDAVTNADYIGLDVFRIYSGSGFSYPLIFTINTNFSFTDISKSSSYRMVGLPGNINVPLSQLVSGSQKTDWNAFYDNGAAADYLVEYNGSANFTFKPGNGFWLLSKNSVNVNVQANSVSLAGDNTYSIPLHSGWNIISNPFERSTNWAAVQNANGLTGNAVIYDWGGTWTNPTSFLTHKGYYFNNITGLNSLKIPYDASGTLGKLSFKDHPQIENGSDIKFSLLENNEEMSKVFIGFNSNSINNFDKLDYFAPPGDFDEARIVIFNGSITPNYKYLMKESRKEIGEGQAYFLDIKNKTKQELILKVEGLSAYNDYQIYLVDERLKNEIKLTKDSEIRIPGDVEINNYRFLIGTEQFIVSNKGELTPKSFALYQNYPNPFNPTTKIRYSIPSISNVQIMIYDLLGNEIATLINEQKNPGNYEINFDASNLASGVYVYKMRTSTFTDTKKMLLLR